MKLCIIYEHYLHLNVNIQKQQYNILIYVVKVIIYRKYFINILLEKHTYK